MNVNVMIDPSLFFGKKMVRKIKELEYVIEGYRCDEFTFYVSKDFYQYVMKNLDTNFSEDLVTKFFFNNASIFDKKENALYLKKFLSFYVETRQIKIYTWKECEEKNKEFWDFYESFRSAHFMDDYNKYIFEQLVNILFDEWVFLQTQSVVISRLKKIFNKFIDSGAVCLQFGKRVSDEVIRKTLKLDNSDSITALKRLRATAKWIAIGGDVFLPPIKQYSLLTNLLKLGSGFFILLDP